MMKSFWAVKRGEDGITAKVLSAISSVPGAKKKKRRDKGEASSGEKKPRKPRQKKKKSKAALLKSLKATHTIYDGCATWDELPNLIECATNVERRTATATSPSPGDLVTAYYSAELLVWR